jgi:dipeptidyl aminopeptidase/acylaminoacyl peptidase
MIGMTPDDVYRLVGVSDPRISPDGKRVAYVVSRVDRDANEYKANIWIASLDGSETTRQLTFGERRDVEPRWSPDGTRLSFTSNRGGGAMQLYVMRLSGGGDAHKLTDQKEDVKQTAWSPDGSRIAFVARVRADYYDIEDERKRPPRRITRLFYKLDNEGWTVDRPNHLFVVSSDGSAAPTQLTSGDYENEKPTWSPDGSRLAFVSSRHPDWDIEPSSDIYVVRASGGEPVRLTAADGFCESPSWSPAGSTIALRYAAGVFDSPKHTQLAIIPAEGGKPSVLTTSLDRNCGPYPELREPIWFGSSLVFAVEDHGNTHVYRVAVNGQPPEAVVRGELAVTGYDAIGDAIVYTASTPTSLSELYAGGRRLTDVGESFCAERELCGAERFTAVSPDGSEVDAWMIRPVGFEAGKRYPLLLNIHGGPFTQYGNKFFDEFQVYAGAGYAVVFSNPRGSSGYTEAWGRAIRGPVEGGPGWGSVDYADLMAVVDESIKRFDFVDPQRLGVMGGSYGGYMTSWIVGHTDRFKVAISERAVNDVISESAASDIGIWFKAITGAHYWEQPEAMWRVSPATYAKNVTTPLLIIHSENDLRCPVSQGEDLFIRLRILKRRVEFVRFPAESHELSRSGSPFHRVKRFEIILDWLGQHLIGKT